MRKERLMKSNFIKQWAVRIDKEVAMEYAVVWVVSLIGGIFIGMAL